MRLLPGFLISLFLAAVAYGLPSSHIIGGDDAEIGEFPYMAALKHNNNFRCGGSIINKRYILTTASCILMYSIPGSLKSLTVHLGTNFLNETGDVYTVEKATPHADVSSRLFDNDIGVLRLTKDIVFKKNVKPIRLGHPNFITKSGDSCVTSGWGILTNIGPVPNSLQKLHMFVLDHTVCKENSGGPVQDSHVCAFAGSSRGICHGDVGNPLVIRGIQIGIASFGRPCALGSPDVFTRVSSFNGWLANNMKL